MGHRHYYSIIDQRLGLLERRLRGLEAAHHETRQMARANVSTIIDSAEEILLGEMPGPGHVWVSSGVLAKIEEELDQAIERETEFLVPRPDDAVAAFRHGLRVARDIVKRTRKQVRA